MLLAQDPDPKTIATIIALVVVIVIFLGIFAVVASYFRLWIQSALTGAGIRIWDLLGMTFRKVNAKVIVRAKIMAVQSGIDVSEITTKALEAHAAESLPSYMVPKQIRLISDMPLNQNGKIDRKALLHLMDQTESR